MKHYNNLFVILFFSTLNRACFVVGCWVDILCGAMPVNFFNSTAFQGWVLLQEAQLSHAVKGCEGRYGGVCQQEHKERRHGSEWEEVKYCSASLLNLDAKYYYCS